MITDTEKKVREYMIEDVIETRKLYKKFIASMRATAMRERALEERSLDSYRLTDMLSKVMSFCHQQVLDSVDEEMRLRKELREVMRG